MYCMNCGTNLPSGVRFCAGCGAPADTEATRLVARPQDNLPARDQSNEVEQVIFLARPTFLFIGIGYAAAALGAVLFTVLLAYAGVSPTISVLLALPLLLIPAYYHLKRNALRYTLTDSKIEIIQGLTVCRTRNIPLRNIQDVTVSATITQRLLGLGDVVIDNASEEGGTTLLRNIPDPRRHAELLLRELRRWH